MAQWRFDPVSAPTTDEWMDVPDVDKLGDGGNYLEPSPIHPDYDWYTSWRVKPE